MTALTPEDRARLRANPETCSLGDVRRLLDAADERDAAMALLRNIAFYPPPVRGRKRNTRQAYVAWSLIERARNFLAGEGK